MSCCEKCWEEALSMSKHSIWSPKECYENILKLRELSGTFCSPKEQAGQFWDEKLQCDKRYIQEKSYN